MKMDWDNLVAKWSESPAQEVKRLEPARQALLQAMKEAEALATSINSEL